MKFYLRAQRHPHIFSLHDVAGDGNCFYSSLTASPNSAFRDGPAVRDWLITRARKELLSESKGKDLKECWEKSRLDVTLEQWVLSNCHNGVWDGSPTFKKITS